MIDDNAPIKRFIAGAVCPRCSEMDKIKAWSVGDIQHRECVACGFHDSMDPNAQGAAAGLNEELPTRVNHMDDDPQNEISVVKILDPR